MLWLPTRLMRNGDMPLMLQMAQARPLNPELPASHQDLQALLDPEPRNSLLDLGDLVNLDHLVALASLALLKAHKVQAALFNREGHQDLQVPPLLAAQMLLVSPKFQVHLPAHRITLLLLRDQGKTEHPRVQLVLLDLANLKLLQVLLVLRIH